MKKILLILLCLPMIGLGQDISSFLTSKWSFTDEKDVVRIVEFHKDRTFTSELIIDDFKDINYNNEYYINSDYKINLSFNDGYIEFEGEVDFHLEQIIGNAVRFGPDLLTQPIMVGKCISGFKFLESSVMILIKRLVEGKINEWQQKGEFEKTTDYLFRVNEKNRTVKIKEFQEAAIESIKLDFLNSIDFSNIELGEYDADNETFLLKDKKLGDLVLPVPISEARLFKNHFSSFQFADPKCVIIDDKFVLSYLELSISLQARNVANIYTYNLSNTQDYAITDIDYKFSSIEIDDIKSFETTKSNNISANKIKVGTSSVNINIPTNKKVKNRYALVIGNEDYTSFQTTLNSEQNVDYAVNDATIFKKYCLKTLGVREDNMFFITNATAGKMNQEIKRVTEIVSALGSNAELIFYYAGHGYPDEITKSPYLIPVDVSGSDMSYAVKLDDLYKALGETNAKRITIFLDACFTGGGRTSGLVASRGVKVKPKEGTLNGNIVVFAASSGDQSALPYHKEGHGVFTYHLLKQLQANSGDIKYGTIFNQLEQDVNITSLKENSKKQNPKVNTSQKVIDNWRNWKF